jgi:hypothetical protein
MFTLMRDVVDELSPKFQVIVSDHADLEEELNRPGVSGDFLV